MPDTTAPAEPIATGDEARHRSLIDDATTAARQARDYIASELEFQKARALHAGAGVRTIAVLMAMAVLFAAVAVLGLLIAAIAALATVLSVWASALVVTGVLLATALVLVALALGRWRRLRYELRSTDDSK